MTLTSQQRADILLKMMNPNKPHGKSAKEFEKEVPDLFASSFPGKKLKKKKTKGVKLTKGAADLTINFGDNPEYPLNPAVQLPYEEVKQSSSMAVMAQDPEVVYTMYSQLSDKSRRKIDKMLQKKGKQGFIHAPQPAAPSDIEPKAKLHMSEEMKKLQIPEKDLQRDHKPLIFTKDEVKQMVDPNKKRKKAGAKDGRGNPNFRQSVGKYQDFLKRVKEEPFYGRVGAGSKRSTVCCVYELLKELNDLADKDDDEDMRKMPKKVIKALNELTGAASGGSDQPRYLDLQDVTKMLTNLRRKLHDMDPRVRIISPKIQKYSQT